MKKIKISNELKIIGYFVITIILLVVVKLVFF
jgi:hypothetical protein